MCTCSMPCWSAVCFLLRPCERAVVTFIQSPMLDDRYPDLTHLEKGEMERVDRTLENRSVCHIEVQALFLHYLAGGSRLSDALSDSGTSVQPVNTFSRFHVDCP